MNLANKMRIARDITLAFGLGLLWVMFLTDLISFIAQNSEGQSAITTALAEGNKIEFLLRGFAWQISVFALPSLFFAYLILRVYWQRPMVYAFLAGVPAFCFDANQFIGGVLNGGVNLSGIRGVAGVLDLILILVAIPACVALLSRIIANLEPAPAA